MMHHFMFVYLTFLTCSIPDETHNWTLFWYGPLQVGCRVGRDDEKSVVEVLQVLYFEPSPSMSTMAVEVIFGNNGNNFLKEQIGEVGSEPSMSPGEALDGPLSFLLPKDKVEVGPCSSKVGLGAMDKSGLYGLTKWFLLG